MRARLSAILYYLHAPFCALAGACALACSADPSPAGESGDDGGSGRCVADADGRGCRCGANVSEIAGWHEVDACDAAPAGEAWSCCDAPGSCACGVPRCLDLGGGRCTCAAFVEVPPGATEVASCSELICCDRGHECECSATVLTCAVEDKVDECTPPMAGMCAEMAESTPACEAP